MIWETIDKYEKRLSVPGIGTYIVRRSTLSGHWLATMGGDFRCSGPLRFVKGRVDADIYNRTQKDVGAR